MSRSPETRTLISPIPNLQTQESSSFMKKYYSSKEFEPIRRPRSETMPTTLSIDTNENHFLDSVWSPTTDQLLKGDDNNTIKTTFASLGLDNWYENNTSTTINNNRPRASSVITPHPSTIWNNHCSSYLHNSNSSADLLELMARQRTNNIEDINTWTGDDEQYNMSDISEPSTRSLWLPTNQSTNDLYLHFFKFGHIEKIHTFPERKLAAIHFVHVEDAIKAKESLNKLALDSSVSSSPSTTAPIADQQEPTRALWVGNIPINTTQATLNPIFSQYGPIESVRVLSNKNCAFINYHNQEDAINAKSKLSNTEIMGPGTGQVKIGFAKPAMKSGDTDLVQPQQTMQTNKWMEEQQIMYRMNTNVISAVINERKLIVQEFGQDDSDGPLFDVLHFPSSYFNNIPAAPELGQSRKIDIARLRDIRKRLDAGTIMMNELEVIAIECIDELVELCSDYIGNTVIQRLFERCSELTKSMMLEKVAPYLASIGVHKNGTWAAQKIIDTARLPTQIALICAHIKHYVPALLLDQFGNYVVQGCLGLGPTRNHFIFDAIVDSCWEIAQGRFGARAVRATLESPHVTKRQQKYVAASLVQHALLLATNANGALLLIWFLDTSGIPGRYKVLAPRLLPHLAKLGTHKLASLTVLKLVNQRQEPEARTMILDALFFSTSHDLIDEVLQDQVHGVSLIQKILSSSYIELRDRQRIAERVKQFLHRLKLQHVQGYKRLMEEINMVMTDSTPGMSAFPGLAAALQATYLNEDEDAMANFYAAK